tara:strand:- start:674 stop:1057 length:384 start_codon:yes stop_codon:yes gene_type:complete
MEKINYNDLNSKQKENYNYHKTASALADYGYDSMRLNNDWQGADFIAVKDDEMLKVQLKGRFTIDKKYIGKNIHIAFIEDDIVKFYKHDDAVNKIPENVSNSSSWADKGSYHWGKTPEFYRDIIRIL